jgi:hypothetical protein
MGRRSYDSFLLSKQKSTSHIEEHDSRQKLSVEHLRIFGCHVYIHAPKDKRKKLEPLGKQAYSLDIVNHQNHIESMFQVGRRLKSAEA